MHDAMPETGVEIRQEPITNGSWIEYISADGSVCMEGWIFNNPDEVIISDHDIELTFSPKELDGWIAMLQRAQSVMKGGV
jgi:hypothetical protein